MVCADSDEHPLGAEISDMIIAYEPGTTTRKPVFKSAVVAYYHQHHNKQAARIVNRLPMLADGALDPDAIDQLLVAVHGEVQRLSEEFMQARRLCDLLGPLVAAVRQVGNGRPIRVVDVGCGTGYALRWLATYGNLGDDVQLVGADYNVALIREAARLAQAEDLSCRFEVANAFDLDRPGHIFYSVGVVHHFRGDNLARFFQQQMTSTSMAFVHFDIKQSWLAAFGSWLFHIARMRQPIARHDGVLSARRAHSSEELIKAARSGDMNHEPEGADQKKKADPCQRQLPGVNWTVGLFDEDHSWLPIMRVMHGVVAMRAELVAPLHKELGQERHRLELSS